MNKDIERMIELQRYWDNVLRGREDMGKSGKSISFWEEKIAGKRRETAALENEIKNMKSSIKQKEIELEEKDGQAKKLEERKMQLKTPREVTAADNEMTRLDLERGQLEEDLIGLMDALKEKEDGLARLRREEEELKAQSGKDITMLKERIGRFEGLIAENQGKFDALIDDLSPPVKTKYIRLVNTGNGKGVVAVKGEICDGCNFQIPLHLALDSSKDEKIVTCTNCNRFIYREP